MIAASYAGWAIGGSRGIEEIQAVIQRARAARMPVMAHHYLLLANTYQELGRTEEALAAVQAGLGHSNETHQYEISLYRVQGEVLLDQDPRAHAENAERCFRHSLEIAREREAKFGELQAATSLGRLLRDQGRRDEARALLAPVYDWFTEGFDTADLKDAKALLDEL
jgi:tetratricopeptide (TPR) repeat protein